MTIVRSIRSLAHGPPRFLTYSTDAAISTVTVSTGAAPPLWTLRAAGVDVYVAEALDRKGAPRATLSCAEAGGEVDLWTGDDGSGRQRWAFETVGVALFRIAIADEGRGLADRAARYLTLDASTGAATLAPLAHPAAAAQLWELELPPPRPQPPTPAPTPTPAPSSDRIEHTNFVLIGDGRSTSTSAGTFSNPLTSLGFCADPGVYRAADGTYYVAATGLGGVWSSRDLVNWAPTGSIDPQATFWAPEIYGGFDVPGGYACVFCDGTSDTRVLASASPAGPFEPYADLGFPGGSGFPMDPHVLRTAEDPQCYLFTSAFGPAGGIQVHAITPDLRTVSPAGAMCVAVLEQPSWMREWVAEGPQVLRRVQNGVATYYLVFSANQCCKAPCYYSIGYATAPSPEGPWTLAPDNPLISFDATYGYGHHCFTVGPNGGLAVVFQRDPGNGGARQLMLTGAHFESDGRLVFDTQLYGTKTLP